MLKLSIITINKNNAPGLRKTIQSVINQTYQNIEYIVIDGGSTDESVEVIKEYDQRIYWWISEPDKGIYNAMNKGILKANGDYCQFLNSGDLLCANDVTDKMVASIGENSIVTGNMIKILPNGKKIIDKNVSLQELTMLNFFKGTLNHSSTYIKRHLFEEFGLYDENLKIVSDWKFFLQAIGLYNATFAYRDIDVTIFDMQGISNTNHTLELEERQKVLEEILPSSVLKDYENHWFKIKQMDRINSYFITRKIVWLLERILFKLEKWHLIFK